MTDQIEPYAPKPGSIPWRVIKHMREMPAGAELSRRDIGRIFGVENTGSIDTLLQLPCSRGVLLKGRNGHADLVWRLGSGRCLIADSRPIEETPAAPVVATAPPLPPAVAQERPATRWVQPAPGVLVASGSLKPVAELTLAETVEKALADQAIERAGFAVTTVPGPGFSGVDMDRAHRRPPAPAVAPPPAPAAQPTPAAEKPRAPLTKPLPADKPYLAEIRAKPLADARQREAGLYAAWLAKFKLGDSAEFRLAQIKDVETAVTTFTAGTAKRFRVLKISRYRAGIERTA